MTEERERAVERLKKAVVFAEGASLVDHEDIDCLLSERAELLATVEMMRLALWPFAQVKPTADSGFVNICALNVDVIAARAALTTGEEK